MNINPTMRLKMPGIVHRAIWTTVATGLLSIACNKRPSSELEHVTIQLDWKPGAEHTFLYAGKQEGFFRDAGIDLEIVTGTGSPGSAESVHNKVVDFALCAGESAVQARSAETPQRIVALAVFYSNTPTVIYSLATTGIEKPTDLYGRKLGIMLGSSAHRNYEAFARKLGLDRTRIEELPVMGDITEVYGDRPTVDAMVDFGFQHPLRLRLLDVAVSEIQLRDYGIQIYGQGLITHEDLVERNPSLVRRMTQAIQRSYLFTIEHPSVALAHFLQTASVQDSSYSRAKLEWVNSFVASSVPAQKPIGFHGSAGWQATIDYLREQGLLSRQVLPSAFWTTSFLDTTITLSDSIQEAVSQ